MKFEHTQYGFAWGSAEIQRSCSDQKKGWVMLSVKTPKEEIQVYVTKSGKVRLFGSKGKRGEWKFPDAH